MIMEQNVAAVCDCGVTTLISKRSYHRNQTKNGRYTCISCKLKQSLAAQYSIFICEYCKQEFKIRTCWVRGHSNKRRFCSLSCSMTSQREYYARVRSEGKRCSRCGEIKPITAFSVAAVGKKSPRPNKIYQYCIECKRRYRQLYHNKLKIRALIYCGGKCVRCGLLAGTDAHPVAFDFHHRDPQNKEFTLSKCGYSWSKIKDELDKCDLLCAICHRTEHINHAVWPEYEELINPNITAAD